jgi:hypothetical protein
MPATVCFFQLHGSCISIPAKNPSLHNNTFGLKFQLLHTCSHGSPLADFRKYFGKVRPHRHIYESHRVIKRDGDGSSESRATTGMETALRTPSPHFLLLTRRREQKVEREEAKGRRVSLRTLDSTAGRSLSGGEVGDGENGDSQGLGGTHWHVAGERGPGRGHSWNTPPSRPYRVRTSIIYGVSRGSTYRRLAGSDAKTEYR